MSQVSQVRDGDTTACVFCQLPLPDRTRRKVDAAGIYPYCCYGCELAQRIAGSGGVTGQNVWMLTRLGTGIVLSMAVMVFTFPLYAEQVHNAAESAGKAYDQITGLMRYASFFLASIVFVLLGFPIAASAWEQSRQGRLSTDLLIVIGVAATMIYSGASTLSGSGATYFETSCMILVLVTLGRYLEAIGKTRATESVVSLSALIPDSALVLRDNEFVEIPSKELKPDDVILVRDGEAFPADGVIVGGTSHVDERLITGESEPVVKQTGDTLRSGTTNLDGAIRMRVTLTGAQSTVGRLTKILQDARASKGHTEQIADRVAGLFTPVVVVLAVLGAWYGFGRGGSREAIMSALAVLLISCPCALGIATPMVVWIAYGLGARRGVVIRSGQAMESLARVRAVAFDKTGTLTSGEPRVAAFLTVDDDAESRASLLAVAGGLASSSTHVFSQSVQRYVSGQGITPLVVNESRSLPGLGLVGSVNDSRFAFGSATLMDQFIGPTWRTGTSLFQDTGAEARSISYLASEAGVLGMFTFEESLREDAQAAIDSLTRSNLSVTVLTGDRSARAEAIGRQLGVTVLAEQSPEQKCSVLDSLRRDRGTVVMVGDGLNDAPALAAADVGIALGCGADLTRDAASVCVLTNELGAIPWTIRLAQRTIRTVRVNLFWAFVYNAGGIPLAIAGVLTPVYAALAMVASSVFVVGNSLRLRTKV